MSLRQSRRLRIALVAFAMIVVLGGAVALWMTVDDRFYVHHADVVGARRISPDEIFEASGLRGLHILWAHSPKIEARILDALPTLRSAEVACGLPANCTITIEERQPKMTWEEGGKLWWIDGDGVVFPAEVLPSDSDGAVEGWLVHGPLPRGEDDRLDERVRVALSELWASGVDLPSELHYVPDRGLFFVNEHGWRIVVGHGEGMDERLRVAERLVAHLASRELTPRFVDVRFPSAPYYSLTNEW